MRLRPALFAALAFAASAAISGCHDDVGCVYITDCQTQGSTFVCVPDSSGFGHCVLATDVFGFTEDAGTGCAPDAGISSADGGLGDGGLPDGGFADAGPEDAGLDGGLAADAGVDAGMDAGSQPDAGSDAGRPLDAGTDAG